MPSKSSQRSTATSRNTPGARLQREARMRGADVGQQARAVGKRRAREFLGLRAGHQRFAATVPNQAP